MNRLHNNGCRYLLVLLQLSLLIDKGVLDKADGSWWMWTCVREERKIWTDWQTDRQIVMLQTGYTLQLDITNRSIQEWLQASFFVLLYQLDIMERRVKDCQLTYSSMLSSWTLWKEGFTVTMAAVCRHLLPHLLLLLSLFTQAFLMKLMDQLFCRQLSVFICTN